MSIVRQMPELYLRGGLANVTMRNLSKEEIEFCEEKVNFVANHELMKKHKYQVIRVLGETIGGDYRENRQSAEQEYTIAIWRAVVNLFYHRHYKFRCLACNSTEWMSKSSIVKPIDQAKTPCPNCGAVKIIENGESKLVNLEELQKLHQDSSTMPDIKSSIIAIPGADFDINSIRKSLESGDISPEQYDRLTRFYRYDDPHKVFEDPNQMSKFFGEFVWSYFKQHLRENARVEHNKTPTKFVGRADEVLVQDILSLCRKNKIKIIFCEKTQPENGWWVIRLNCLHTSLEFSEKLIEIVGRAKQLGVLFRATNDSIEIRETFHAPMIETYVIKPEHALVVRDSQSDSDCENSFCLDHVNFKTIGGIKMDSENHVAYIDRSDIMDAVYRSLPDGNCQKVFELYSQTGETYIEFHARYNYNSEPKQTHIADFLGITTRAVKQHLHNIKMSCLMNQLVPANI